MPRWERMSYVNIKKAYFSGDGRLLESFDPQIPSPWRLHEIRLHLDAAAGDETITARLDSDTGGEHNVLVFSQNLNGLVDVIQQYDTPLHFEAADILDFDWVNAGSLTYGLEILYSEEV